MGVLIHAGQIPWHMPFAQKMQAGLKRIGIDAGITSNRERVSDVAILLGTTLWRQVEATGRYLLVDRCSFGDTNQWVSLVWDGHGRRGNHRVPEDLGSRWESLGFELRGWQDGSRVVLCGQTEPYSPHWERIEDWYATVDATHFRPHPAGSNPTGLPVTRSWDDCGLAVTLNSSVGVDALFNGVRCRADDEGSMAWGVDDREAWVRWLAWTQWHHDEVAAGIPHLFEDL